MLAGRSDLFFLRTRCRHVVRSPVLTGLPGSCQVGTSQCHAQKVGVLSDATAPGLSQLTQQLQKSAAMAFCRSNEAWQSAFQRMRQRALS